MFNYLPNEIIYTICNNLLLKDIYKLKYINKNIDIIINIIKNRRYKKKKFFKLLYNNKIFKNFFKDFKWCFSGSIRDTNEYYLNLNNFSSISIVKERKVDNINNIRNLLQFPILTFKKNFMGSTNYIDGIYAKDLLHPIMIGLDSYNRMFISMKYYCKTEKFKQMGKIIKVNTNRVNVITIFQRYSNNNLTWCKAGTDTNYIGSPILNNSNTSLSLYEFKLFIGNIYRILENMDIKYMNYKNPYTDDYDINTVKCELVYT
jgi:hypothetical protein